VIILSGAFCIKKITKRKSLGAINGFLNNKQFHLKSSINASDNKTINENERELKNQTFFGRIRNCIIIVSTVTQIKLSSQDHFSNSK